MIINAARCQAVRTQYVALLIPLLRLGAAHMLAE